MTNPWLRPVCCATALTLCGVAAVMYLAGCPWRVAAGLTAVIALSVLFNPWFFPQLYWETRMQTTLTRDTAQALHAVFLAAGFAPGLPPHVTPADFAVDQRAAAKMRCPGCNQRGLQAVAYRNGNRMRVNAYCPLCRAAEEV